MVFMLTISSDHPITAAGASAVAAKPSQSQPKETTEADKAKDSHLKNSDPKEEEKDDKKPRSTSRGVLGRLKSKKDEVETKQAEKNEEKEEPKPAEDNKVEEGAVAGTAVGATAAGAAVAEGATCKSTSNLTCLVLNMN